MKHAIFLLGLFLAGTNLFAKGGTDPILFPLLNESQVRISVVEKGGEALSLYEDLLQDVSELLETAREEGRIKKIKSKAYGTESLPGMNHCISFPKRSDQFVVTRQLTELMPDEDSAVQLRVIRSSLFSCF